MAVITAVISLRVVKEVNFVVTVVTIFTVAIVLK